MRGHVGVRQLFRGGSSAVELPLTAGYKVTPKTAAFDDVERRLRRTVSSLTGDVKRKAWKGLGYALVRIGIFP